MIEELSQGDSRGYIQISEIVDKVNELVVLCNQLSKPREKRGGSCVQTITLPDVAQATLEYFCKEAGVKKSAFISQLIVEKATKEGIIWER